MDASRRAFAACAVASLAGAILASCRLSAPNPPRELPLQEGTEAAPCAASRECPATGSVCAIARCVDGSCRAFPAPRGTLLDRQSSGDCRSWICDGHGRQVERADNEDRPSDDANACTIEVCAGGSVHRASAAAGVACGESGVCSGAGVCGVCLPGARRCSGGGAVAMCDAAGQWSGAAPCPATSGVCSERPEGAMCVAVAEVSAGAAHTCARIDDGSVRCFGSDDAGQVTGAAAQRVPGVRGVVEVGVGDAHACARLDDGSVRCWGNNDAGQLGDGTRDDRAGPVVVRGVTGATQLAVGGDHACARLGTGAVYCWGRGDEGQLGDGGPAAIARSVPSVARAAPSFARVELPAAAVRVAAGWGRSCALLSDGTVTCWGADRPGRASATGTKGRPIPIAVVGVKAAAIATGDAHTCALLADGSIRCWGRGTSGQLGDGAKASRSVPAPVRGIAAATAVDAGADASCARGATGVLCWGANDRGQLGAGPAVSPVLRPAPVLVMPPPHQISVGGGHSCAIVGGALTCWGRNEAGQVGDRSSADRPLPVLVSW